MKRPVLAVALILIVITASVLVSAQGKKVEKARDPVCGIMVDKNPDLSVSYRGEVYYFCSKADMEKFKQEPDRYVKKR
jgi:Cu+-exporting ATPase